MLYFCTRSLPYDTDWDEFAKLREFKNEMRSQGLYAEYQTVEQFEIDLYSHLDRKVQELVEGKLPLPQGLAVWSKDRPEPKGNWHPDPRLLAPIDFGSTLSAIAAAFAARMDEFDAILGAGPDKFLDLGRHHYDSAA